MALLPLACYPIKVSADVKESKNGKMHLITEEMSEIPIVSHVEVTYNGNIIYADTASLSFTENGETKHAIDVNTPDPIEVEGKNSY